MYTILLIILILLRISSLPAWPYSKCAVHAPGMGQDRGLRCGACQFTRTDQAGV